MTDYQKHIGKTGFDEEREERFEIIEITTVPDTKLDLIGVRIQYESGEENVVDIMEMAMSDRWKDDRK